MRRFPSSLPAALLLLAAGLPAQTFVVDASNGAGAHFTTIAAAASAVPDGATLLLRPGVYGPFQIQGKGLTLLGGPGVEVANPSAPAGGVAIGPTSVAQPVVLRGITLTDMHQNLTVTDCAGLVVLEDIADGTRPAVFLPTLLTITRSPQVTMRGLNLAIGSVWSVDSHIVIESSTILGVDAFYGGAPRSPREAVSLQGGSLQVTGCTLEGGHGDPMIFFGSNRGAIAASNAELRLRAPARLTAGHSPNMPVAAAITGNGALRLDPAVVLVSHAANAIAAGITVQVLTMPAVLATSASPGGTLQAAAASPIGGFVALILGLPGPPVQVFGIPEAFWIDPATAICPAFGVPQSGAPLTAAIPLPNQPGLLGARVAWQAVAAEGAGLTASNPSIALVR